MLEKSEGVPGIHCLCMHGSPGFSGELENYCIHVRLHVARSYIIGSLQLSHVLAVSSRKKAVFNHAVLYTLGGVGKPGMVLKDEQMLAYAGSCVQPRQLSLSSLLPELSVQGDLGDLPAHLEW